MIDPQFPDLAFTRDAVACREALIAPDAFLDLEGAAPHDKGAAFSAPGRLVVRVIVPDPDLSRFNQLTLSLTNVTQAPLLVGLTLVHGANSPDAPPPPLSLSGGREVLPPGETVELRFPVSAFGTYGHPEGWSHVPAIEVAFNKEKNDATHHAVAVVFEGLFGERLSVPLGPRLTETGLNLVFPVGAQHAAPIHDRTIFRAQHAAPLQERGASYGLECGLAVPPPHPYADETADEVLQGRIMGQRLTVPPDWEVDPTAALEWRHFLHRHHFMRRVILAYTETGDDRYALFIAEVVGSWIEHNPAPLGSNGGAGPSWETLSVAWRLRAWLRIVARVLPSPAFDPAIKSLMLRSLWEHAQSLTDHQGHPNNWAIVESAALALAGMCLPEFRDAPRWRDLGLQRLAVEMERQFFDDGAHFELSPLYHAICLEWGLEVLECADAHGSSTPPRFRERLLKAADYLAELRRPDFTWPSINDSGSADRNYCALLKRAGELLGSQRLVCVGTKRRQATADSGMFRLFPDAGIFVYRSSEDSDAHWLFFRAGPVGATHFHGDALSFEVTTDGVPRLIDPGITGYAPDALTDWHRSAAAHNCILVDGKGLRPDTLQYAERIEPSRDRMHIWEQEGRIWVSGVSTITAAPIDLNFGLNMRYPVSGAHAGDDVSGGGSASEDTSSLAEPGSVAWSQVRAIKDMRQEVTVQRTIVILPKLCVAVHDRFEGEGEHEVSVCFQLAPGRTDIDAKTLIIRCEDARGPGLDIIPLPGPLFLDVEHATGNLHPPRGWVSLGGRDIPAPHYRFNARGTFPMNLVWVLTPRSGPGDPPVKARRTDRGVEGTIIELIRRGDGAPERLIFTASLP